jgi:vacuolar protein sorting-associated protein 13A/C
MFEAQVAFYLNQYLGKYVYGLDAESLRISVWNGDVELRNLQLKPEALAELNLPITVKAGLLGRLTLKVRVFCSLHRTWRARRKRARERGERAPH